MTGRPGISRAPFVVLLAVWLHGMPALAGPTPPSIALNWHDCVQGAGASQTAGFDCMSNTGSSRMIAAIRSEAAIDSVIGVEAVIDLMVSAPSLPDWWALGPGGCRAGRLDAEATPAGVSCPVLWGTAGVGLVQDYLPGEPRSGPNQARIKAVVAVIPSDSARTLEPGVVYSAFALTLSHEKSSGLGACSGCALSTCLVLNSIIVRRLPGTTGDVVVSVAMTAGGNQVSWQAAGVDCSAVPVERTTWGRVKGMYR